MVFFLVGLGVAIGSLNSVAESIGAKNWVPTEAIVMEADLKVVRGDDSTTYRARGQYKYNWDGQTYTSDQILFGKSSDSSRKFHEEIVSKMRTSKSTGVQAFEIPDGHAYYFKAARHKMTGIVLSVLGVIFGGVGIAPFFTDMPMFMGVIFAGFAVLLVWLASIIWFYKTQIETSEGALSIRSGMFAGSYKTVRVEDISSIEMTSTMTSGNTLFYDVFAKSTSGDKIKMAIHLIGKRDVQALIDKIKDDLGMKPKP